MDSFNGTTSDLVLPSLVDAAGNQTLSLWFKTSTAGGVLFSSSAATLPTASTPTDYAPSLYVGSDGHLYAEFWNGKVDPVKSTAVVDDGKWHNVVLAAGASSQTLYVDGTANATLSGSVTLQEPDQLNDYVGAGYIGGSWPAEADYEKSGNTGYASYFTGDLGDVSWYNAQLSATQVSGEWSASKNSAGSTPTETETVTDPGGNTLTWVYDLLNGGRVLSQTDARGETTTYGYNVDGFQNEVVNPDGDYTQTGYDVRGNVVSTTTCQDQATKTCSTSYDSYYPDDTSSTLTPNPLNDVLLTSSDGRSASLNDTTYQTKYTYNSLGELTAVTTPPVAGSPSGRTTSYLYTDGTTTAGGYQGATPPKGLQYQVTTPGGAVTTTLYSGNGDVAETIDPDGLQTVYGYDQVGRETSEAVTSDSYPPG